MSVPLSALVQTWKDLRAAAGRGDKRDRLSLLFSTLDTPDLVLAAHYLSGDLAREAPGVGAALVSEALQVSSPASVASLVASDLDRTISSLGSESGPGSIRARVKILGRLLSLAT